MMENVEITAVAAVSVRVMQSCMVSLLKAKVDNHVKAGEKVRVRRGEKFKFSRNALVEFTQNTTLTFDSMTSLVQATKSHAKKGQMSEFLGNTTLILNSSTVIKTSVITKSQILGPSKNSTTKNHIFQANVPQKLMAFTQVKLLETTLVTFLEPTSFYLIDQPTIMHEKQEYQPNSLVSFGKGTVFDVKTEMTVRFISTPPERRVLASVTYSPGQKVEFSEPVTLEFESAVELDVWQPTSQSEQVTYDAGSVATFTSGTSLALQTITTLQLLQQTSLTLTSPFTPTP